MDTFYSDAPAIDDGAMIAQLCIGAETSACDAFTVKTEKQFVNMLEDVIQKCGAPTKLISDSARVEISNKVADILRALFIQSWQSKPHRQHQNPSERCHQTIKQCVNTTLDWTGAPACCWFLCVLWVCFILNHSHNESIRGIPMEKLTGQMVNISPMLCLPFWTPVCCQLDDSAFPSDTAEGHGHCIRISENCGHKMTCKILTDDTRKVITHSIVHPAHEDAPNLHLDPIGGEKQPPAIPEILKSMHRVRIDTPDDVTDPETSGILGDGETDSHQMPTFNPSDLTGRTFLMDEQEDGQCFCTKILERLEDFDSNLAANPTRIKFPCEVNDEEEIISRNEVMDCISREDDSEVAWKFKHIVAHQGPLKWSDPSHKGSLRNVLLEWENGEVTAEPLNIIGKDDPVTCAEHARDNGLLNEEGWKQFRHLARRSDKLIRLVNQAKLHSCRTAPRHKCSFEIPRDCKHALQLNAEHKNTKWKDATDLEMQQLDEHQTFKDMGLGDKKPPGCKKTKAHLVHAVKHDGCHKARMVADGHLTDTPAESVCSGVVSSCMAFISLSSWLN